MTIVGIEMTIIIVCIALAFIQPKKLVIVELCHNGYSTVKYKNIDELK